MRYEGKIYRPPSEADSFILQATIGCSWNACTYCDMYREKAYRERAVADVLADVEAARRAYGPAVETVFVADGDALGMELSTWLSALAALRAAFPRLRRVSSYATARNLLAREPAELQALRAAGLTRLYIGPESGDDVTLKRIAKGATAAEHVAAAERARAAGMELSVILLLGAGGVARSAEHAAATAALWTAMDPAYVGALTLTVVPGTPLATLAARGGFTLPSVEAMLGELRVILAEARPTRTVFRTNHASGR